MFYYLALNFVQGIGSVKYKALLSHFKSPEKVFKSDSAELCKVPGIGKKLADAIISFDDFKSVENELKAAKEKDINILRYLDFPESLRNIDDSPPILYVKGDLLKTDGNSLGIVGARRASIENLTFAEDIGYKLSASGVTITSGMAVGIDSSAHRGALKAGGRTVAVLGSGVDVIYPYSNKDIYHKIAKTGAVISEFRIGAPPNKENFPKRNRIISGLSKGLLVIEASQDSGSLITAEYATKQGKKIFAVPGDIRKDGAKGTNNLIKRGALLVDNIDDILNNIKFDRIIRSDDELSNNSEVRNVGEGLSASELSVYGVLDFQAIHIDDIIKKTRLNVSLVAGILLNLELKGVIKQFSGKMFVKV